MEDSGIRLFDLNIEKVLEDWEIYHAIREIIANALDEQLLTRTKEIEIFKDGTGKWHIRDFGRGLKYQHLTQNENEEKLANPNLVIGKFGVGLKDALATFDRHGVRVLVRSKYGDITIMKSEKHGFQDIITLHASISRPGDKDLQGTEFILEGCTDKDIETAKSFFLKFSGEIPLEETHYGSVLEKVNQSKIYINGLRVAEEENFLFSYNITSITQVMRKALNREKIHLGRTAYADRIKAVLLACEKKEVAELLARDLRGYETGFIHDELKWNDVAIHACKLLNAQEKVIFLTPSQLQETRDMVDRAKSDGLRVITIPENVRDKISGLQDYSGNVIRDLEGFRDEWNQSFDFKFVSPGELTKEERMIFDRTRQIAGLIGGLPGNIERILISETMRMETMGYREAAGLWEASERTIIIKRTQLRSLRDYAATLLHEIVHAKSGTGDVSREFEDELTSMLGLISSNVLTAEKEVWTRSSLGFKSEVETNRNLKEDRSVSPSQQTESNMLRNTDILTLEGQAFGLEKEGKLEDAKRLYWHIVDRGFDGSFPYERLRIICAKQQRYDEAIKACGAYINLKAAYYGYDVKSQRMKDWIRKYEAQCFSSNHG
jgi:hypothetical protein